jgi:hypothetical protein
LGQVIGITSVPQRGGLPFLRDRRLELRQQIVEEMLHVDAGEQDVFLDRPSHGCAA